MSIYLKLLYLSIFFLTLTFTIFTSISFFIFETIIILIFFTFILKEKEILFTKVSTFISYIFIILISIGLLQATNYHTLLEQKTYFPFSLCPFLTLQDINFLLSYLMLFLIILQISKTHKQVINFLNFLLILFATILLIMKIFPDNEFYTFFVCEQGEKKSLGIFINRNSAGSYFSLAFFVSLSLMLYDFVKMKISNNKDKAKHIIKFSLETILTIFLFRNIILASSRGALLATIISIFAFFVLFVLYFVKEKNKKRIFIITILFVLFTTIFIVFKNLAEINFSAGRIDNRSEQGRLMFYGIAIDMLKEYPLTGIGLSCSKLAYGYLGKIDRNCYLHNDWLEIPLGVGYPITAIILFLILLILKNLINKIKSLEDDERIIFICLCCGLLSFCITTIFDFHFHTPTNAILVFSILAIVSSLYFNKEKPTILELNKKNIITLPLIMALLIFLLTIEAKKAIAYNYCCYEFDPISRRENCVKYCKHPEYLERLVELYYDLSTDETTPQNLKLEYKNKAHSHAEKYLTLYPFNKRITHILNTTKI